MAGARFVNAAATYDVLRDFSQISLIETSPFALVASPTLPAKDLKEFIALARSRPGKMSFGTIGAGQVPWWAVFLFNHMAGVNAVDVTYKDTAGAMTDVMTGRLDYFVSPLVGALSAKDKLRVLAVTSAERSAMLPEVPSIGRSRPAGLRHAGLAQHHGTRGHAGRRGGDPEQGDSSRRSPRPTCASAMPRRARCRSAARPRSCASAMSCGWEFSARSPETPGSSRSSLDFHRGSRT
jgi:hypothetical protein